MIRYEVTDAKGREVYYKGFDWMEAHRIADSYTNAGIPLYVESKYIGERDYEDNCEYDDPSEITYYEDEELTSLYGDKKAIKKKMIERIENDFDAKVINRSKCKVTYDKPYGDSNATFTLIGAELKYNTY